MRTISLVLVLVLASFSRGASQGLQPEPGQRVRITVPTLRLSETVGKLYVLKPDTVWVLADSLLHIPLGDVTRMEVSRGRSNLPVVLGAIAGAAGGAAVGIALVDTGDCTFLDPCEEELLGPPVLGAAVGALVGAGVGVALRTERWEEVSLDRLQVSIAPTRDGFGIGARIAF